jgi:hypothetical protein
MALFAHAVNAQMFTPGGAAPARLSVEPTDGPDRSGVCEVRARAERVPLAAWAHLLAMLRKNHDALEPLQRVLIEAAGAVDALPLQALVDAVPQHLRDDEPDFTWSTAGAEKFRNIRLDLEFRETIQPDVRERVEHDLSVWLQLNLLGAFDMGFEEAQDLDPIGTVKVTSAYRIECFVPCYTGDMSGMVALENLLLDVHHRSQALEEASLE